jgi:hypothetical protein
MLIDPGVSCLSIRGSENSRFSSGCKQLLPPWSLLKNGKNRLLDARGSERAAKRAVLSCWPMTKLQTAYKLSRKLTDEDLPSVSRLTSIYGIFLARIAPSLDELGIEFDAARLTLDELEAVLEQQGLPIVTPVAQ